MHQLQLSRDAESKPAYQLRSSTMCQERAVTVAPPVLWEGAFLVWAQQFLLMS